MNLYHECQIFSIYGSQVDILCGGREEVCGAVQENFEFGMHWSSAFQPFFPLCMTITNKTFMCIYFSVCLSSCQFTYYLSIICLFVPVNQSVQFLFIFHRSKLVTVNRRI